VLSHIRMGLIMGCVRVLGGAVALEPGTFRMLCQVCPSGSIAFEFCGRRAG
jgi:hypothetical protein